MKVFILRGTPTSVNNEDFEFIMKKIYGSFILNKM